jgi:deoxyribodipyrimidine photolyase-related protein
MREDWGLASRTRHHKQKLVFFFSAMRHFAQEQSGVEYHRLDPDNNLTLLKSLKQKIHQDDITEIYAYEPADKFFQSEVLDRLPCTVRIIDNPMFLVSNQDWFEYRSTYSRLLMNDFYILQRKKHGYLVDSDGKPEGGRWNFDAENRKKLPASVLPPPLQTVPIDSITQEVIDLVENRFSSHPGRTDNFAYPVTRELALIALQEFLDERFELFGEYEDAISQRERTLFHSVLSPLLNIGLLTPREVVEAALLRDVPLNSKEGFLRQILGWREFVHHLSRNYHVDQLPNQLGNNRKLAESWWTGETGIPPLDCAIRRAIEYGWCHHIERLMVIGAVMVMCEVRVEESFRWFMDMFVDSADWVMLPNVVAMSQFADPQSFATKPYVSSSNYILKMSDWKRGEWSEIWDGLYWRFLDRHRTLLMNNPRMAPMYQLLDKMDVDRRTDLFRLAESFMTRVTVES